MTGRRLGAVLAAVVVLGLLSVPLVRTGSHHDVPVAALVAAAPEPVRTPATSRKSRPAAPLAGIRIALDPGHQLGNHRFPAKIKKLVPAGGFTKPCNTTGTATNAGYPEATVNYQIAMAAKKQLEELGAQVFLTRNKNSESLWGPCVNTRGAFGKKAHARLMVSLHADGARSTGRGFHVIAPRSRSPWTTDIAAPSLVLAKALRSALDAGGLPRSNYTASGNGLVTRSDLGTLNLSDVPVAMIEIGNMRNVTDARLMTAAAGRSRYAAAVVAGIRAYLHR